MQNRKLFVWPLLLIGALAFFGSYAVGANHFWISYGLLVVAGAAMYALMGRSSPSFRKCCRKRRRRRHGADQQHGRAGFVLRFWFVGYLNGATGSPAASYMFMAIALVVAVVLTLIVKPTRNGSRRWLDPVILFLCQSTEGAGPGPLEFVMKPSIVLYKSLPADLRERLEQHFTVHAFNGLQPENREELRRALQQAEGIIGSGGKIDEAFLQQAPKLRAPRPFPSATTTSTSRRSTRITCC